MQQDCPRRYAVKALARDSADSGWREAAFMRRVGGCENVVRLEKVVEEREFVYLVMEWCEMDLYDVSWVFDISHFVFCSMYRWVGVLFGFQITHGCFSVFPS